MDNLGTQPGRWKYMRDKFNPRIMILVFTALLACAPVFASLSAGANINEIKSVILLTGMEIRNPEIALQYGVRGYLEITYPSGSPSSLAVNRGGEININILLHFVSYCPEVTEAQATIDPNNPCGPTIGQGDVIFNDFVSYNPSGDISMKAGETLPVVMSIRISHGFPTSAAAIPLGAMGITTDFPTLDELGGREVTVR